MDRAIDAKSQMLKKIRVPMTLRISQFAVVCGLSMLALPGVVHAQAPRYQSPMGVPTAPQPQVLPTPPAITPNGTVVEDVIVRVNDQIITRSDLERSEAQLQQELAQGNAGSPEERQKNLLRDMIDQQLLLSRGKELGLNPDAEVIRRLDEIRKQNHMDTMEDLERAARQQGVSFEDFKANIKNGIITQEVVRDEVGRRLQVTQAQEQAFYEAHKNEFEQPEQVRLSEILIPTPADASDAVVAQAQAKAEDVAAKLKAGAKFEDLAKTYSGGQTAAQGGDLGVFKRGSLAKVLEDQTFSLKAGDATAPIRTRQGFVILKVTEHQAAGVPPMKEVEPQIQEAMYMDQMQPALRAYLTKLREDAYIDIKPGFVDSGASSKQTKPVFTAYTPPVVKKKKAQQKERFDRSKYTAATSKSATAPKPATAAAAAPATTASAPAASAAYTSTAAATDTAAVDTTAAAAADTASSTPPATAGAAPKTTAAAKPKPVSTPAKPKKVKKEKVRFGQAPQNSLPAGPQETASGADTGAGASSAAVTPGGMMAGSTAPGAAIAPTESTTQLSASSDPDPLGPKTVQTGKTRFSSRQDTEAATKAAAKATKAKEKAAATPVAMTADEKATQQTQAAPLGLNGDTAKKPKKAPKVKGAPKERLQDKEKQAPTEAPGPAPTVNPALGTSPAGTTPVPAQPSAPPAPPAAPSPTTQQN
jgi:peptidyl-prolyl cis-trans isomerase SurA